MGGGATLDPTRLLPGDEFWRLDLQLAFKPIEANPRPYYFVFSSVRDRN